MKEAEKVGKKDIHHLPFLRFQKFPCIQFSSVTQSCTTLCNPMHCSTPGFPVHHHLPELAQTHVHRVGDAILPSHPLLSPSSPAFNLSQHQGLFSNESVLHIRWPKCWHFSFNVSPSNEYSGLISFRIDWFDLLAVQGTLKSLLQHHSSKASVLQCSAFFMVQLLQHTWLLEKPQLWLYTPLHYEVILLVSVDCDSHPSGFRNVLFIFSHS